MVRVAFTHQFRQCRLNPCEVHQAGAHIGQPQRGQLRRLIAMGAVLKFQKLADFIQAEPQALG